MSISGPEALHAIEDALGGIRNEEDEVTRRLARSAERLLRLAESEAELFRQLASGRADAAAAAHLDGPLKEAAGRARAALRAHGERLAEIENELDALDQTVRSLADERAAELGEVERLQAALKDISASIADTLAKDEPYQAKRRAAAEAARRAREWIAKTNQADLDREVKARPYREDRLFSYLLEIGYGTEIYRANPLTKRLDRWVARLIRFETGKRHYLMLNDLPLRLRALAGYEVERAAEAQAEVDAHYDRAIDAAGGEPLRRALAAAHRRIAEIDSRMIATEDARDERVRLQRELAEGHDPALSAALSDLGAALRQEPLAQLLARTRRGAEHGAESLAGQIDSVRRRAGEEEADADDLRARLNTLSARRRELEDILYEFKKARFDDPRSSFRESALVGEWLTEFLRGGMSAAAYWDAWQKAQRWAAGFGGRPGPWGETAVAVWAEGAALSLARWGRQAAAFTRPRPDAPATG